MSYQFTFTNRFNKNFKSLTQQEKRQLQNKLKLLGENPLHPSLRTKRVKGTTDLFECSVNMDIRIIWHYENNEDTEEDQSEDNNKKDENKEKEDELIILLDVGHHDIFKQY